MFKRMADKADLGKCYRLYKDSKRDIGKIELNEDEELWLAANGIPRGLPEWREWIRVNNSLDGLKEEIRHLKSLTTRERRDKLRRIHGGRMRRIQDDADAGKIGAVIRSIMANSKSFSLEVLYDPAGNVTDSEEISRIVTAFFREWFNASDEDRSRDEEVAKHSGESNTKGWLGLAERLKVHEEHAVDVLEGMKDEDITEEGKVEAGLLSTYTPTLEEFNNYIDTLNPRSAGGPSGLTYLLAQKWPENVRSRMYDCLKEAWIERKAVPGWGRRWL
jgi:hypothetical protein